jgi:ATP-dependent DNA helicase RecG
VSVWRGVKLSDPVQYVKGVGPKRAELLEKGGLATVEDLIFHLPFRYEDRRNVVALDQTGMGEIVTLFGKITGAREVRMRGGRRTMLTARFSDDSGWLSLVWFHQASYFKKRLDSDDSWVVHGKVEASRRGGIQIVHPEIDAVGADEDLADIARIVPVYQKPTDVPQAAIRMAVGRAVEEAAHQALSVVPDEIRERQDLVPLSKALRDVHAPDHSVEPASLLRFATPSHRTLIFEELFALQTGMNLRKKAREAIAGTTIPAAPKRITEFTKLLPFELTGAQKRVIGEIAEDLAQPHPMNRLVHGDVGSGKTVVAFAAALQACAAGYQVAVMAPTELLAEQHFATMRPWAEKLGLYIAMLTGSMKASEARSMRDLIAMGGVNITVGTHALVQESTRFKELGLAIVDEQHRFGVMQRAALRGEATDTLLLSATPIPRTLSLVLFGDLDVAFLDEMPPGRQPVITKVIRGGQRKQLHERMAAQMAEGHQCYIVYPLVEESEKSDLKDATSMAEKLQAGVFKDFRVGLLHGRMKSAEKEAIMRRFKEGDLHVLVATTVIEVGIDVPNASIMVVEHAERFGLAQLHQLRGRVGRGGGEAFCCLIADEAQSQESVERLGVMETSGDGFEIAEADLRIRGPGEYLGTRQSGVPAFRAANLVRDAEILELARTEAGLWLDKDPALERPESAELKRAVTDRFGDKLALAEVG